MWKLSIVNVESLDYDPEWEFISGRLFDIELPKEKSFLWKYFTIYEQRLFVKYYLTYGSYTYFTDHTGLYFSKRWMRHLKRKMQKILHTHKKAKEEARMGNFEILANIESGRYKFEKVC